MFFDGWVPILRVLLIGTLSYITVVALLRYFGKRARRGRHEVNA
jgi:hypothetical protein